MVTSSKTFWIMAGLGLWLPLVFSFLGAISVQRAPGVLGSQLLMVLFLVAATLLLGALIGKVATEPADRR
ncbi:MAG TPA: hypothetical protein VFS62_00795 [Chloroflexota bacterium]|nr:hypothetical protein [Chloroflexota bacterium]